MASEPCLIPGCAEPGEHQLTAMLDNSLGRANVTFEGYLCTPHRQQYFPPPAAGAYSVGEAQTPLNAT